MTNSLEVEVAIKWLNDAAKYFSVKNTHGEDIEFWANTYNSENAKLIAALIQEQALTIQELNKESPQKAYERGFQDGWKARGDQISLPWPYATPIVTKYTCALCGMKFDSSTIGYCCPREDCPSAFRCYS